MPARPVRKFVIDNDDVQVDCPLRPCDLVILLTLILAIGFTAKNVYTFASAQSSRRQEESIICIKEFDSSGCNPFNMSATCQEKLECIKDGDGLGTIDILDIIGKHVKNSGAVPVLMIMLALANEVRRRRMPQGNF